MSHDRKPGRVKVVQPGTKPPQRRRADGSKAGNAGSAAPGRPMSRKGQAVLIVLFLLASIGSAIAVELQLPS